MEVRSAEIAIAFDVATLEDALALDARLGPGPELAKVGLELFTGAGPRAVQFINLPQRCTIRIYAMDGTLVRTLEHESALADGAETWDLLTKENMEVSYGVYFYHVDAPGVGTHTGKIFLIK